MHKDEGALDNADDSSDTSSVFDFRLNTTEQANETDNLEAGESTDNRVSTKFTEENSILTISAAIDRIQCFPADEWQAGTFDPSQEPISQQT